MKRALALAAGTSLAAIAVPASASQNLVAGCSVRFGSGRYDGLCIFLQESPGNVFSAWAERQRSFFGSTGAIAVRMPGYWLAEVRGMRTDGTEQRWGTAVRSPLERSCWVGIDFSVCVY
jgi:hypothetical protein